MTPPPINLTQLAKRIEDYIGPPGYIAWDTEPGYVQVYGDCGTIAELHDSEMAALLVDILRAFPALIDTAEAAIEATTHGTFLPVRRSVGGHNAGVPDTVAAIDMPEFDRLRESLARYTTTT